MGLPLCRADALAEGAARGFVFGAESARQAVFVLRHAGEIHAYRNACPYQGTPLEIVPNAFFDRDAAFWSAAPTARSSILRTDFASPVRAPGAAWRTRRCGSKTAWWCWTRRVRRPGNS
ncbi:MAG: Rieske (2Fe-2S) protein [Stellaceae bacterium]